MNQSYVQLCCHPCIHIQDTGWQSGVRSCITSGLPTHLVQELNVGTVHLLLQFFSTTIGGAKVQCRVSRSNIDQYTWNYTSTEFRALNITYRNFFATLLHVTFSFKMWLGSCACSNLILLRIVLLYISTIETPERHKVSRSTPSIGRASNQPTFLSGFWFMWYLLFQHS